MIFLYCKPVTKLAYFVLWLTWDKAAVKMFQIYEEIKQWKITVHFQRWVLV
jgi:hypothetical protein